MENLVGEAKREGLEAIPSAKFKNNLAFFQVVMLAYNIWRYLEIIAQMSAREDTSDASLKGVQDNTIRIARLKLLLIARKLVFHNNRHQVKYSIHDTRTPSMVRFLKFFDKARRRPRPWTVSGQLACGIVGGNMSKKFLARKRDRQGLSF